MRPDKLLLQDILDSVKEVIDTTPAAQADFDANKLVQSHLLRHIQIIGEASWRLSQPLKARLRRREIGARFALPRALKRTLRQIRAQLSSPAKAT